jgi:hypothetical protein
MAIPVDQLLSEINAQRSLMIAVSTGGPRIESVNREYQERREKIRKGLAHLKVDDPNPHADLWHWYGKWSGGDLPTYQSRRQYIAELYQSTVEQLTAQQMGRGVVTIKPTGWSRVDHGIDSIRHQLEVAKKEAEFQAVGLLCREVLISLAQAVYTPLEHPPTDGVKPSDTDAKRMLEAYLAAELAGAVNESARRYAKSALSLANDLQHSRTANFKDAALCSEATRSVVNTIAIVSGRRGV